MKTLKIASIMAASLAPTLSLADSADVIALVDAHNTAYFAGDYEDMARMMPSGILEQIAANSGRDVDDIVTQWARNIEDSKQTVRVEGSMFDQGDIVMQTTDDGTEYAVVVVTNFWRADADTLFALNAPSIVFEEDGDWVMTRVQTSDDVALLTQAYPQFKGLTFPQATRMRVESNEVPQGATQ